MIFVKINNTYNIVKVALGLAAAIALFLTLIFAPWLLKLSLFSLPLVWDKLRNWSVEEFPN